MRIVFFLIIGEEDSENYIEIETSIEELGIRPVVGDNFYIADKLWDYYSEDFFTEENGFEQENFFDKTFKIKKCEISEMNTLFCHCCSIDKEKD